MPTRRATGASGVSPTLVASIAQKAHSLRATGASGVSPTLVASIAQKAHSLDSDRRNLVASHSTCANIKKAHSLSILSDWAREFLREDRVAVVSTLNKDGSPQVTTIWYLLQEDGTLIMSTPGRTQKVKNLLRDPRIAVCVGDERRSVSLYGTVTVSPDQNVVRQDLEQLAARYMGFAAGRNRKLE